MIWYIIFGMLASFGGFCALWAIFGGLLPGGETGILIFPGRRENNLPAMIRRALWLRETGLMRCRILVADAGLCPEERAWLLRRGVELYDPAAWPVGGENGESNRDGTGNGNITGHRSRRGVSEL